MQDSRNSPSGVLLQARFRDGVAGTFAGAAALLTGHPFDTIKVRMQTQPIGMAMPGGQVVEMSMNQQFWGILRREGALALYKGVASPMVGMMLENAILFPAYQQMKQLLHRDRSAPPTTAACALAGGAAGAMAAVALTPIELVKCRLQVQRGRVGQPNADLKYKGSLHCVLVTMQEKGVRGLFRGLTATLAREIPGSMVFFGSYEAIRKSLALPGQSVDELPLSSLIVAGGLSGCLFWSACYPFDTIKSRMQTLDPRSPASGAGFVEMFRNVWRNEGVRALYKGYLPTMARAFPTNAVLFSVYEFLTKWLAVPS